MNTVKEEPTLENLFVYGSFMKGYVNNKYLKEYYPIKAVLPGYRRCWPRNKETAILIYDIVSLVKGELYCDLKDEDLRRIDRLYGIPHDYRHKKVIVTKLENNEKVNALIHYPNAEINKLWLQAEARGK